ncbi:YHS domain-containing (seleno)protein [Fulvivirga lutimaris]|uniref:YHS domain-containing (seleno)protein n=1 Tax=Fulvivirga lutimaris TaxID=1819566 RepID=UPI0012BD25FD|nr:YHS domain-containing (seleno)protein [Fulvivirga lutimaris]MTI38767.1 YHS domain-containing protein [Fulvivirga lutimaris]
MKAVLIFLTLCAAHNLLAQDESTRLKNYNVKKALAIDGYDPVSYFEGQPLEGNSDISSKFKGITYYFASKANKSKFDKAPASYEPQYGGWCAYAIGDSGEKVKVDPETFKIIDGKLYLFYNFWGTNTLELWNEKENELHKKADENWKKIGQ